MKQEEVKKRKPWVFYLFDKINFKQKGPLFFDECPNSDEIAKMEKYNIVFYYNRLKPQWVIPQYFSDKRLLLAQNKLYRDLCKSETLRILLPLAKQLLMIQNTKKTKVQTSCKRPLGEELPKFPGGGYSTDWRKFKTKQLAISINRLKDKYEPRTKTK